ncbi:MAG: hypothetical protein FWC56_05515 [Phycisphaerae bacterium]|nr:hypothetical protein [Phycisphaerae bacterium]
MASLDARTAALQVLGDLREGRQTARNSLDALIAANELTSRDVGLTRELVFGVVRHRLTLAAVLSHFTRDKWRDVAQPLQNVLMLGAYQIIWLDAVPVFAAVNEAVNQAKRIGGAGPGRFVNGVLRELDRKIEQRRIPAHQADPIRAIPIDLQTCCQLSVPILPDPDRRLIEPLSQAMSQPSWLVSRWIDAYGPAATRRICLAGILRPPIFVRSNRSKTTVDKLMQQLADEGFEPQLAADGESIMLGHAASLTRSPLLTKGFFQPQDPIAALPVRHMNLQPGQVVLDLCAGLGTKATQAAEKVGPTGTIIATDIDDAKLAVLATAAEHCDAKVETVAMAEVPARIARLDRLDWILIDAPCSNTGVLARRPEIRYRLAAKTLGQLADTQLSLLEQAADLAQPQTRLLYSTCSIDPEENEQVSTRFVQSRPDWQYCEGRLTLPNPGPEPRDWHDGGYFATFVRKA